MGRDYRGRLSRSRLWGYDKKGVFAVAAKIN
jgi:hypothetical protein